MAKYTVRFSCGHTEVVELVGKESERQEKIAYYEKSGMCSECYKEQKKSALNSAVKNVEFVELSGSEKQISWADTIRKEAVAKVIDHNPPEEFYQKLNAKTEASWWIDNRYNFSSPKQVAKTIYFM